MKIQSFLIPLFLILSSIVMAQTTISGSIIIDESDESLAGKNIIIINKNSNKRVLADENGLFTLDVNLDDNVEVKSPFTETRVVKITENILNKKFIQIHLDIETIQLAEANIRPLDPNLKKNINTSETAEYKLKKEIGYDTPEFKKAMVLEHKDAAARRTISAVGGVNLLGLATAVLDPKLKKDKPKQLSNFEVAQKIKAYYSEEYFENSLKIPTHKIQDFVSFCVNKYNFQSYLKDQNYDMIVYYMETEAPIYLRLLNSKP